MRDIAVTFAVFASLPFILKRPWIGILMWTWLGFMNPHRLAWGFSTEMPFAMIVAVTTMISLWKSKEPKVIPWTRESILLFIFVIWMIITTFFAINEVDAWQQFDKVMKIQLMIFIGMILITDRMRLHWLIVVIALSIGFYGVKGGYFTILHGGVHRVQGPWGSFISGNNEMGLALAMTVPLLFYLYRYSSSKLVRPFMLAAVILTAIAAIGTQSRGALIGMSAMGVMFVLRGRQKFRIALIVGVSAYAIANIMPQEWYDRMATIKTYESDASAIGRLEAWEMAFYFARTRITGGGFETFNGYTDAHSIYFEVLGEQGFVGLTLFLLVGLATWLSAWQIARQASNRQETMWLADLLRMVQVSLVAYAATGAFLGMAYYDYTYNLVLIVAASRVVFAKELAALGSSAPAASTSVEVVQRRPAAFPATTQANTLP